MSIILFIIILGVLIFVHEFGHFITAKKSGIRVDEFAIGFPPKIISWTRKGTKYALNLIPFGGYVKIFGENPEDESLDPNAKDSFVNKNRGIQAAVLFAGVFFNAIFAWLIFSLVFMIGFDVSKGALSFVDNSKSEIKVLGVENNSPAERLGVKKGAIVWSLTKDGKKTDFGSSETALDLIKKTKTPFSLQTSAGEFKFDSKLESDGEEIIGVYLSDVVHVKTNLFGAIGDGFLMTGYIIKETSVGLWDLISDSFHGKAKLSNVAGPVGIVGMVKDAAKNGFVDLLVFTAFISINLAILNLLPLPALDGGRLLFVGIEAITRKRLNYKVINILNLIGFALLIILMIVITISDIGKLF